MAAQIRSHMDSHDLGNTFQSAYKVGRSTETALLCIKMRFTYLCPRACLQHWCYLTCPRLSILSIMTHSYPVCQLGFGFAGSTLKWCRSYQDRFQSVKIGSSLSNLFKLKFGVPQGSVLGPLLFSIYTTLFGQVIRKYNLLVKSSENILALNTISMLTILSCSFTYPLMIVPGPLTVLNPV